MVKEEVAIYRHPVKGMGIVSLFYGIDSFQ